MTSVGRSILAVLLTTAVVAAPASTSPAGAGQCSQPYSPVYEQGAADPPPAIDVSDVTVDLAGDRDFDGDGTTDSEVTGSTVRRPAGDITFARGTAFFVVTDAGQLDGEPGHEMWVMELGGSFDVIGAWLVPYSAPAGVHDPATVGITMPAAVATRLPDDAGAVWVTEGPGPTGFAGTSHRFHGADLLAVGVPGDATAVTPTHTVAGSAVALVDFGGTEPSLLTATATSPPSTPQALALALAEPDGTITEFTHEPVTLLGFAITDIDFSGLSGASGRFVVASIAGRSGSQALTWSLDDPCAGLMAAVQVAPPTTPAAQPVAATPTFTG